MIDLIIWLIVLWLIIFGLIGIVVFAVWLWEWILKLFISKKGTRPSSGKRLTGCNTFVIIASNRRK